MTVSPPAIPPAPATARADLLVLMLHRSTAAGGNPPARLEALFAEIARRHRCVLPGEPLEPGRLNVCLSFDDAYYDFYYNAFPLLRRHGLRALLAVSAGLIPERSDLPPSIRLVLPDQSPEPHTVAGGLCTWGELGELAGSGQVAVAAHGWFHERLDSPRADLGLEVDQAGETLRRRLGVTVDSFVFPHGRLTSRSLARVRAQYRYALRIGSALNSRWDARLLYRVPGDGRSDPVALFGPDNLRHWRRRAFWNRLRRR